MTYIATVLKKLGEYVQCKAFNVVTCFFCLFTLQKKKERNGGKIRVSVKSTYGKVFMVWFGNGTGSIGKKKAAVLDSGLWIVGLEEPLKQYLSDVDDKTSTKLTPTN